MVIHISISNFKRKVRKERANRMNEYGEKVKMINDNKLRNRSQNSPFVMIKNKSIRL